MVIVGACDVCGFWCLCYFYVCRFGWFEAPRRFRVSGEERVVVLGFVNVTKGL